MAQQTQIEYPEDLRAPGAIDRLIAWHHQTFGGFVMEDDNSGDGSSDNGGGDGGGDNSGDNGDGDGDDDKDLGFPKDTPVAQMTADQQASYFRNKADKEEARRKGLSKAVGGKTAEQIKADLAELDKLRAGNLSDTDKKIKEAEDAARRDERVKAGNRIAKATFEGALGHLDKKDRDELLDGLNLSRYIDDDGEVDTDKVRAYAARIAPVDTTTKRRDYGQGKRTEGTPKPGAAGKAEAARRFNKTKSTADA